MMRFGGTVAPFCLVDCGPLASWIAAIDFADWPQQHRLPDGKLRPAMVTDPAWHGFAKAAKPVTERIVTLFDGCATYQHMLSAVMPGHAIEPHCDEQAPYWLARVHVPLLSNERSAFVVDGTAHAMSPGMAYLVNTLAEHSVRNDGDSPRVHFMFDVKDDRNWSQACFK
jgi:hypothetical protein